MEPAHDHRNRQDEAGDSLTAETLEASSDRKATIEAVRRTLAERGAVFDPPATEDSIRAAEQKLGVRLPDALRELYGVFGSARTNYKMWRFWSPESLGTKPIGSKQAGESHADWSVYLVFCDALIWLPAFAVCVDPRRTGDMEVLACLGERWYRCANSLDAFLKLLPQQIEDLFIDLLED